MKAIVVGVPDYAHQQVDVVSLASGAARRPGGRPHRRPEREAGPLRRQAGSTIRIVGVGDRTADGAGQRRRPQHDRRPARPTADVVVLYATPATVAARRRPPATAASSSGSPTRASAAADAHRAAARSYLRANTAFTGFSDLPADPRAGRLAGQGPLRPARVAHERVHGARAAGGARADREHDDDADRRADGARSG